MNVNDSEVGDPPKALDCLLIAGGEWHDIDFARLELLKLLAQDRNVRVQVRHNYEDVEALRSADFLISYTCNVAPSPIAQKALRDYVAGGGRWFALHGTNAILQLMESGRFDAPDRAPLFMHLLGTAFLSHPPIAPYRVDVTDPGHPLVAGIAPFEASDELYLLDIRAPIRILLHSRFQGRADAFVADQWPEQDHAVLYLRQLGEGAVLYLTLGHCRGHHDMRPMMDYFPEEQRGSWDLPEFQLLLRRGVDWAKRLIN